MQNLVNKKIDKWERVWERTKFDDLEERDERFFSIVVKGALSWLTRNIVLYNKPIKHFIFNTGSSYLYIESNGYSYSTSEVSGEDQIYMEIPRCICTLEGISIPTEELTSPFSRGQYERKSNGQIAGFNADIRRIPIEMQLKCHYVLSTFNEACILSEELIQKLIFNKYYKISFLGQVIQCSIDFPTEYQIEINKIDMASTETNLKSIEITLKISSCYPQIDMRTEIPNDKIIGKFGNDISMHNDKDMQSYITDEENQKVD